MQMEIVSKGDELEIWQALPWWYWAVLTVLVGLLVGVELVIMWDEKREVGGVSRENREEVGAGTGGFERDC